MAFCMLTLFTLNRCVHCLDKKRLLKMQDNTCALIWLYECHTCMSTRMVSDNKPQIGNRSRLSDPVIGFYLRRHLATKSTFPVCKNCLYLGNGAWVDSVHVISYHKKKVGHLESAFLFYQMRHLTEKSANIHFRFASLKRY